MFFFELRKNRIGYSRIGRTKLTPNSKDYIYTPDMLIPLNDVLLGDFNFVDEFGCSNFLIKNKKYLKKEYIEKRFKDSNFLFTHSGTIKNFQDELEEFKRDFKKNSVFPIVPFHVPNISPNYNFAVNEIDYYISIVKQILTEHQEINFGITLRFFDYSGLFKKYKSLISEFDNIKVLNLSDLFDSFSDFRNIIEIINIIKNELDNNLVIMASGKIIPKYYPILTYLGVDLIDSSYLLYLSAENLYNSTEYFLPIHKLKYPLCNCLACKGNIKKICEGKRSDRQIEDLTFHNLNSARDLMRKIKQYLLTEDFRAFVEKSSLDDTKIISLLKILDKEHFSTIQSHTKLIQKDRIINCLGESSYYRPDFVKYRKKVVNNFNPESFTNFLLLLPCSAKKPYSESQSHKKYNSILRKFSEYPSFQELILTSPLGVIPRQLENLYPVNSYNISVTGYWSQEEIEICGEMLLDIIQKYPVNIPVICHLDGDYQKIANYVEEKTEHEFIYSEIIQKPTNKESLESLRGILENEIKERKTEKKIPSNENFSRKWYRKLVKIIDYYFGRDIGENLMNHCNYIKKDYRHNRIELFESKRENKLGTFKFSDGFLYLTINGAQKIAHLPNFSKYIVFDGDKLRGNTFFRPGVKSIGKDLLPDDPVVIFNSKKQKVLAVGKMVVSSEFITNSKSGRIAKIYESK